ncbi:MAG TPA: TetR/AcrR family transcriptional regulator [Thermoleophilaceae bacterium]|nr:TetR/AcrR family transcriptional regulator [Thermoleophilaceae bacterium]
MTPATKTRQLSTAEERRETLLAAAMPVFGERGYHAAPTLEIAKAAGISQAYLFRLFPTKAELFAAVTGVASQRMQAAFRDAAARAKREGLDPLDEMGHAYDELLERDRDVLLIQLHSQVASPHEPLIRAAMQRCFHDLYELVSRESGATPEELRVWFAHGMLCNVMAAINAEDLDAEWARALTSEGPQES